MLSPKPCSLHFQSLNLKGTLKKPTYWSQRVGNLVPSVVVCPNIYRPASACPRVLRLKAKNIETRHLDDFICVNFCLSQCTDVFVCLYRNIMISISNCTGSTQIITPKRSKARGLERTSGTWSQKQVHFMTELLVRDFKGRFQIVCSEPVWQQVKLSYLSINNRSFWYTPCLTTWHFNQRCYSSHLRGRDKRF